MIIRAQRIARMSPGFSDSLETSTVIAGLR